MDTGVDMNVVDENANEIDKIKIVKNHPRLNKPVKGPKSI